MFEHVVTNGDRSMLKALPDCQLSWFGTPLLAIGFVSQILVTEPAFAHEKREALRIDVPSQPRLADTTRPVLFTCSELADCQNQATDFCTGFNYPNGKVLFRDLPPQPRPFPIYSVICFD
ncbi:MAG: hypothetical protein ACR2PA_20205 [Hyphomicrobiaceae bacterium]